MKETIRAVKETTKKSGPSRNNNEGTERQDETKFLEEEKKQCFFLAVSSVECETRADSRRQQDPQGRHPLTCGAVRVIPVGESS